MNNKTALTGILQDPAAVYGSPDKVLQDNRFNDEQKLEILRSWEQDERELEVAEEEGMAGGERSILADILAAMNRLDITTTSPGAPTKQGSHSI